MLTMQYTGTLIADLMELVERAQRKAALERVAGVGLSSGRRGRRQRRVKRESAISSELAGDSQAICTQPAEATP